MVARLLAAHLGQCRSSHRLSIHWSRCARGCGGGWCARRNTYEQW